MRGKDCKDRIGEKDEKNRCEERIGDKMGGKDRKKG